MRPLAGYYQLEGDDDRAMPLVGGPPMRVFQRTAIDEATGRAEDGKLYSLESLQRGTYLAGYVWGPSDLLEPLLRDRCERWTTIRVGKAKSRGQGLVDLFLRAATDDEHPVFPGLLPAVQPPTGDGSSALAASAAFHVTLYSDLIAVDHWLRPVTRLTEDGWWRLVGGQGAPPFQLTRAFVSTRRAGGFLGVPGVPRSSDPAIAAGSTWRFQWRDPQDKAANSAAYQRLCQAQLGGVGLRRGEGYGRFVVDLPLHTAAWDDMTLVSHRIALAATEYPLRDFGTEAQAESARWMRDRLPSGSTDSTVEYRRLFAEFAQRADLVQAVQKLLSDPLHRQGKSKNLARELAKVGFSADALPDSKDTEQVEKFRQSLITASGETT